VEFFNMRPKLFSGTGSLLAMLCMVVSGLVSAPTAQAQCQRGWLPGDGAPAATPYGVYSMTTWDPDGPGPAAPVFVIGGRFTLVGSVQAKYVAYWNGATWVSMGQGLPDGTGIGVLLGLPNGDLIAAGSRTEGDYLVGFIARWTGTSWSDCTPDFHFSIQAIAPMPNGDVALSGSFDLPGGVASVVRWDGTAWVALGGGPYIENFAICQNGDLVGATVGGVVRWNGTQWLTIDTNADETVDVVTVLPNGDVVVGGLFREIGGVNAKYVARWDGAAWHSLGAGLSDSPSALLALPNGDVLASGGFGVLRWDGDSWSSLGQTGYMSVLGTLPDGDIVVAGIFYEVDGPSSMNLARWNGTTWQAFGTGTGGNYGSPRAFQVLADGGLVAVGDFIQIGGVKSRGAARLTSGAWSSLGLDWGIYRASAVAQLSGGEIVAAGTFGVASWDGVSWTPLGSGFGPAGNADIYALATLPNGDVIAGGSFNTAAGVPAFNVARWNGATWAQVGSGLAGEVRSLVVLPDGGIIAGGAFMGFGGVGAMGGYVVRWDGARWQSVGANLPFGVVAVAVLSNGDFVVGGLTGGVYNDPVGHLSRWDGTAWSTTQLSAGTYVNAIARLPGNGFVVGGKFRSVGGVTAQNIAKWNGRGWSPLGSGLNDEADCFAVLPSGDLVVGGYFTVAGGQTSAFLARYARADLCLADFNCSHGLEVQDILDYLSDWFAASPSADFNGNGLSIQDIFDFLSAWLGGC
jgi:hypothetical protein